MRRIDRRRHERRVRGACVLGLGFALGALTGFGLDWRLAREDGGSALVAHSAAGGESGASIAREGVATSGTTSEPGDAPNPMRGRERPAARVGPAPATISGDVEVLRQRNLEMPVRGIDADELRDTFDDARGERVHEALDIMAPRHTPVTAVENGRVARLFTSAAGGTAIYLFDPTETFCYYYAHLDRYATGLREGDTVSRGQVIGYVGSTGNASPDAPHLHFAIFRLTSERQWWKGEPVNPYPVLARR